MSEVIGGLEPVGHAGEQAKLRIGRFDEWIGQSVVGERDDDGVAVSNDPSIEVDEGRDPTPPRPVAPGVEGSDHLVPPELKDQTELFLE